jgi:glycosyltransferase involved in cell wall biosynthesis
MNKIHNSSFKIQNSVIRVGIDISSLVGEKTGYGAYVLNLIKNLSPLVGKAGIEIIKLGPKNPQHLSPLSRIYYDQVILPYLAKKAKIDILHQPGFSAPLAFRPLVLTLHDLRSLQTNEKMGPAASFYWKKWLPWSVKKADIIICDSKATRNDLVRLYPQTKTKAKVIYLGVDQQFFKMIPQDKIKKTLAKYKLLCGKPQSILRKVCFQTGFHPRSKLRGIQPIENKIDRPYFLYLGSLSPIKNIPFLIDAYQKFASKITSPPLLVLAGAGKIKRAENVKMLGYVEEDEKIALLQGAQLFLFPSLYEGFGLPPLEAMACGTPVLCSNSSSLPEVCGQAVLYANPKSQSEWVKKMTLFWQDKSIGEHLIKAGRRQAQKFSWRETARQTLEIYKAVNREQGSVIRDQRSENREQRTEIREQRTENRDQRTENREQRTENREQGAVNSEQNANSNVK